ncbi:heavy-metal-associated domain-containing protein [Arthrobacter frigidicola]|nr:heavy-metal-associated domain-containing protein [Arthrobacter frigidicola]
MTATNSSGCACCAPSDTSPASSAAEPGDTTAEYALTGLTCGSCATRVSTVVGALEGVTDVRIDLIPGGTSTVSVSSSRPVPPATLGAAVEKAGYRLLTS